MCNRLWSEGSGNSQFVTVAARLARERRLLVNALLKPGEIPPEFQLDPPVDLSGWSTAEDTTELQPLEERVRQVLGLEPKDPLFYTTLPGRAAARDSTVPQELIRKEARLSRTCDWLSWLGAVLFLGMPLAGWIVGSWAWGIFGTTAALFVFVIRLSYQHRRERAREALITEQAKCDPRPFCLLLRSFTDSQLGYGVYYSQVGEKGQRHFEGPTHFRAIADGLASVGRLIVLCRDAHDDAVLRSEEFEHMGLRVEEDWISFFRYIAERCRAIVVVPGASPGLLAEIQIIQSDPMLLSKTLVFMPYTPPAKVGSVFYLERQLIRERGSKSNVSGFHRTYACLTTGRMG